MRSAISRFALGVFCLTLGAAMAQAQTAPIQNYSPFHATRSDLQRALAEYEQVTQSRGYSAALRERAKYEATLIRDRLQEGDFRVGDRIKLTVEGEPTLSDSLVVSPTISVRLPFGDTVPLRGVLRSELEPLLRERVARVVKNPVVRTEAFLRIAVLGGIGKQGFYVVRSDALLTDVLTQAGGPGATAKLNAMRIERGNHRIWEGAPLQQALNDGRTIDQLNMRAGDQIVVPTKNNGGGVQTGFLRTALFTLGPLIGLIRLLTQ